MSAAKQYFIMRYRKKHGDWKVCNDAGNQIMSSFDAQRDLNYLVRKFPKQIYRLGVQV